MTHIRSLKLKGFKSFNVPAHIEFRPGLNCIVGANGSGKTNLIDALSFGLGQLSSKTLRADNYADLIFKRKGGAGGKDALVYFEIDNKGSVMPTGTSVVQVARKIRADGSTQFKLNNRNATRAQVVDLLAHAKVNPDGHNIIMQGDVARFVDMKPHQRRQLVEEIAGIQHYEERKQKALSELDKVNERLKEASIVLREKETYLDELFEEKKEAERFRSFSDELAGAKATRIRLEMNKINHNKNLSEKDLKEIEEKVASTHSETDKSSNRISLLNKKVDEIEMDIEKRGGEGQLELQRTIENLRVQIESSKNIVENSNRELKKIEQRRGQLGSDAKELTRQIQAAHSNGTELEKQKKATMSKIAALKKSIGADATNLKGLQSELEKFEQEIEALTTQRGEAADKASKLDSKREILFFRTKDVGKKLEEVKLKQVQIQQIGKAKSRYRGILSEINKLASQDNKISEEVKKLQRDKSFLGEKIAGLKVNSRAVQELIKRDRAINTLHKAKIKGVIGTVAQLGETPAQFSSALKVAAGARLKNIVVDSENTAIRCLNKLKESRSGVATFLPLNRIRGPPSKNVAKKKGVYGLASELIKHDKKYAELFRYIFGNTVVVEDANTAKSLGIGKYKMVTLDGDLFQISGAISGGYIKRDVGLGFQESEIQSKIEFEVKVRKRLEKQIDTFERELSKLEEKTMTLRREKAELEGRIEAAGSLGEISPEQYLKEKAELENELKIVEKQKKEVGSKNVELAKRISLTKAKKSRLDSRVKSIQFGEKNEEVKNLEEREHQLTSELATASAQLENGLMPEQKNIERVLRELAKEETEFAKQAETKAKDVIALEKALKKREAEEQSFFGELKSLFKKKAKLKDELDALNQSIAHNRSSVDALEQEKNELAISKAKIESKLSGLQEELAQIGNPKSLPYLKSINAARNKMKELEEKLEEMGNVNMKALEVYEGLRKEYDTLAWRVGKLDSEKDEIHKVIDEIEGKKKGTFMETFEKMAENFSKLYAKMASKDNAAALFLENKSDPFTGGLQVRIRQDGKYMNVASLSGGEKVIVALALIFAIQEFNPAPFYLLDEVDAALDSVNSEKIAKLLKEYSQKAQIVMISHNDAIISAADYLYGVSMNKSGESKLVSLEL